MVLAELQDNTFATFLNNVKTAGKPDENRNDHDYAETATRVLHAWTTVASTAAKWTAGTAAIAAFFSKQAIQPAIKVAPEFVKIRRALVGTLPARRARSIAIVVAPGVVLHAVAEAGPRILPSFPEEISRATQQRLEHLGVRVLVGRRVQAALATKALRPFRRAPSGVHVHKHPSTDATGHAAGSTEQAGIFRRCRRRHGLGLAGRARGWVVGRRQIAPCTDRPLARIGRLAAQIIGPGLLKLGYVLRLAAQQQLRKLRQPCCVAA